MMNINPKKMEAIMKQLGIKFDEIKDVERIEVVTSEGKYIISSNDVKIINAQGVKTLQAVITEMIYEEESRVDEEDIKILMEKYKINRNKAEEILKKHKGDLASAMLEMEESNV